jgi:hypothetical protein
MLALWQVYWCKWKREGLHKNQSNSKGSKKALKVPATINQRRLN